MDIGHHDLGEGRYGGGVIARHAAITAGLTGVPGLAHNRHCAAGMAAVQTAAAGIRAGMDRLVLAGGFNADSTAPKARFRVGPDEWADPWTSPSHPNRPDAPNSDMSITVGWNTAVRSGISRAHLDAWALRSHRFAIAAIDEGRFDDEVVPIDTPFGQFAVDEHPRRTTTLEKLASLKVLHPRSRNSRSPRVTRRVPTTGPRCSLSPVTNSVCRRWPPSGPGRRWGWIRPPPVWRRSRRLPK